MPVPQPRSITTLLLREALLLRITCRYASVRLLSDNISKWSFCFIKQIWIKHDESYDLVTLIRNKSRCILNSIKQRKYNLTKEKMHVQLSKSKHFSNQCPITAKVLFILPRVLQWRVVLLLLLLSTVGMQVARRDITCDPLQFCPPPVWGRLAVHKQFVASAKTKLWNNREKHSWCHHPDSAVLRVCVGL